MKFLALFLTYLICLNSFAAPMGVSGQNQSNKYPSVIKVPNNQATDIGSSSSLLESGNKNILANPSFEHSTVSTSWTSSSGALAAESSTVIDGKKSLKATFSSQALDLSQDSTLYAAQFADGVQGLAMMRVKTTVSTTPIYLCPRTAGAYPSQMISGCVKVQANGKWGLYKVPFILGATSNGIGITSNGVAITGDVYIDDAFVGAVDLKVDSNPVGPWIDYGATIITATTTNPTKATTREKDSVKCRVVGQDYECEYQYYASSATGAAAGSGGYIFGLPSSIVIDSSVVTTANVASFGSYTGTKPGSNIGYGDVEMTGIGGDTSGKCDVWATSSSTFQVSCFNSAASNSLISTTQMGALSNAGLAYKFTLKFKGAGLGSNFNSYSTTNADTDWADCGIAGSSLVGFGSSVPTPSLQCKRQGGDLLIKGKLTAGTTPTAVEARIPLPLWSGVQLNSASTTKIPSIQIAGLAVVGAQSATVFHGSTLIEPSVSYITLGYQTSTTNALTKVNGNFLIGSGQTLSIEARIPIDGWDNSNIIIGQFNGLESCATSAQCETEYYADISSTGVVSGEEIDFINGNCALATNTFTCTYNTSQFTQAMTCTIKPGAGATQYQKITETASGFSYSLYNSGGTLVNVAASVSCRKRGSDYVAKSARAASSDQNTAAPGVTKSVEYWFDVAAAGTVSNESGDIVNGNCTNAAPSVCTFNTGKFSTSSAVRCWASTNEGSNYTCYSYGESSTGLNLNCFSAATGGTTTTTSASKKLLCKGYAP